MAAASVNHLPTALVLSDRLPAMGESDEARQAWEVLHMVSATHRVTLAAWSPRRVHLAQWRALAALAWRVELVPPATWWSRWRQPRQRGPVESLDRWYDTAVLVGTASWSHRHAVRAGVLVCDVRGWSPLSVAMVSREAHVVMTTADQAGAARGGRARTVTLERGESWRPLEPLPRPRAVVRPIPVPMPVRMAA